MLELARRHKLLVVLGIIFVVCVIGALILGRLATEPEASPQRVAPVPTPVATADPTPPGPPATPEAIPTPTEEPPVDIASADILSLSIPAVGMDVKVSGETWPRQTQNCKGGTYCIDPPVADQAAWYGDPPSYPSVNPVLLYGHTSWTDAAYAAFNNLLAVKAGDVVTVTTNTGIYTYKAEAPAFVPYEQVAESELVYGWVPEKLVLVTCNNAEHAATVVVAYLVEATPV